MNSQRTPQSYGVYFVGILEKNDSVITGYKEVQLYFMFCKINVNSNAGNPIVVGSLHITTHWTSHVLTCVIWVHGWRGLVLLRSTMTAVIWDTFLEIVHKCHAGMFEFDQ